MHHQLPNAHQVAAMSVNELMSATLRLSDLMSEETTLISEMRYQELAKLHDEKTQLTKLLESYQHLMAKDPNFVKRADAKQREELLLLTDDLALSVEENFRKVSVAKAVNQRILQAIMDVLNDQHRPGTYGPQGTANQTSDIALSLNLNQKA